MKIGLLRGILRGVVFASVVVFYRPVAAQEQSAIKAVQAIDEVVVTGTGTEHYLKSAPVQTEVITGRMLRSFSGVVSATFSLRCARRSILRRAIWGPVCR